MNKITVSGRLTKEIELKFTPSGLAVCEFSIGVNDGYGDKQKSYFFDVQVWKGTAEYLGKVASKGDLLIIEGKLIQEQWEKDGQKRSKLKIIAFEVIISKKIERALASDTGAFNSNPMRYTQNSAMPPKTQTSVQNYNNTEVPKDDEIPF